MSGSRDASGSNSADAEAGPAAPASPVAVAVTAAAPASSFAAAVRGGVVNVLPETAMSPGSPAVLARAGAREEAEAEVDRTRGSAVSGPGQSEAGDVSDYYGASESFADSTATGTETEGGLRVDASGGTSGGGGGTTAVTVPAAEAAPALAVNESDSFDDADQEDEAASPPKVEGVVSRGAAAATLPVSADLTAAAADFGDASAAALLSPGQDDLGDDLDDEDDGIGESGDLY